MLILGNMLYVLANLIAIPAKLIPFFDFPVNISAFISLYYFLDQNNLIAIILLVSIFTFKNNAGYRFKLLINQIGIEKAKANSQCVYLYAWYSALRYTLILSLIFAIRS